jgi:hypothetical protein
MTRADEIATEFGDSPVSAAQPEHESAAQVPDTDAPTARPTLKLAPQITGLGASGQVDVSRVDAHPDAPPGDLKPRERDEPSPQVTEPSADDDGDGDAEQVLERSRHESLPEIARHAAGVWFKAAGWTAGTSLRVGNELRKLATDPNGAQEVIEEVTREVRGVARDFLGITELEGEVREMAPLLSTGLLRAIHSSPEALRAQGEQLLREAADVGFDEGAHPAFARIVTELSPDEARILRLLAIEGAQPMVDVRAHNLIGSGSQLIAQSLNMLGSKAGLRRRERVPVYLTNLVRCNLIVLCDDPLERPVQYQVLEAQPEVLSTTRDTVRAKIIRRSVLLTPLGQEFCEVCLPVQLPALLPPADG